MGIGAIFLLGIGLSMDAFAVSVCKGLQIHTFCWKDGLRIGLFFGVFQAGMPLLGWLLGTLFASYVTQFNHWIAFGLLICIGVRMLWEAMHKKTEQLVQADYQDNQMSPLSNRELLLLAIATSIDAMTVGVTFSMMPQMNIPQAILLIGSITCMLSICGVRIGSVFGNRLERKAGMLGGCILIAIGIHILWKGICVSA